jgi:TatD DNase family protein
MIETDCPYLAPEPQRGQRNEPAFVVHVAERLAGVLGLSVADVDRITTTNAHILFGLPVDETPAIVYPIRDSLYVNLTNRCTNRCVFCPRATNPRVKGHWLGMTEPDEPSAEQVLEAIGDPTRYDAIVFCGFGEPTLRLKVMLEVARRVKERGGVTRVNTNGSGDLIAGQPIAPKLRGVIDTVSVSLNTADPEQYRRLCRPEFGERMYPAMLQFIRSCRAEGLDVVVTALDYPEVDIAAVERLARELDVVFRPRTYKHLG